MNRTTIFLVTILILLDISCSPKEELAKHKIEKKCNQYLSESLLSKIGFDQSPCTCIASCISDDWKNQYAITEIGSFDDTAIIRNMASSVRNKEVYAPIVGCIMETYGMSENTSQKAVDVIKLIM